MVRIQISERCLTDRIGRKLRNIFDTIKKIKIAILTATHSTNTPRIEIVGRKTDTSSRWDTASITATPERGNIQGSQPLLKTYPIGTIQFMRKMKIMRLQETSLAS